METTDTRLGWLESIAFWTKQGLLRREMYNSLAMQPDEKDFEYQDRRQYVWGQVQSADAMVKVSLAAMERAYGPISLGPTRETDSGLPK